MDAATFTNAQKVCLLTEKLSTSDYSKFADAILPATNATIAFADAISTLKSIFGRKESQFSLRYKCLKVAKEPTESHAEYGARINRHCEKFDITRLTTEGFKVLMSVKGLQPTEDSQALTKLLSKLDQQELQPVVVAQKGQADNANADMTLQQAINLAERLKNLSGDKGMLSSSSSTVKEVLAAQVSRHSNQRSRHVCTKYKTIQVPVKTTEVYNRPTWRHVSEPCHVNQICTTLKMFQEPAYRDVIRHQTTKQIIYDCCPGWEQASKVSSGCTKPVCKTKCRNGGTCTKPDTCSCPNGFTGKYCELDINECKEHKPCDQLCYNTEGSFYCKCREGFVLDSDGQTCRKLDGDSNGIEARDLENEIDNESLIYRLHKVEKMIASDKVAANELHKTVDAATNMIETLKTRVNSLERKHYELASIQEKLRSYELQSRKLERLVSILFKCRSAPNSYCP